ncbi:MAG: hypothetical protein Q8O82_02135 [Pseudorhodobacter sp.]|nr:hypothetical protein [Pseudorhodobacter sp.]
MAGFRLQRQAGGWAVFGPDGRAVSGVYGDIGLAEVRLGQLADRNEQAAARKTRACLCCGSPFMSEGNHNRLCAGCRTRGYEGVRNGW